MEQERSDNGSNELGTIQTKAAVGWAVSVVFAAAVGYSTMHYDSLPEPVHGVVDVVTEGAETVLTITFNGIIDGVATAIDCASGSPRC